MKLPLLLTEMSEVIGLELTIKFAQTCGGTRIYVPAAMHCKHWIAQTIGIEAARKLASHINSGRGGSLLDVPKAPKALGDDIKALTDAGASSREIARALGIHQRTVFRHRQARQRRNGHQL